MKKKLTILIFLVLILVEVGCGNKSVSMTRFIVSSKEILLKTTDGGSSWTTVNSRIGNEQLSKGIVTGKLRLTKVYFIDDINGYALGSDGTGGYNTILKTIDGGASWIDLLKHGNENLTKQGLTSIYFNDLNVGYVLGTHGTILKTSNGGNSWTKLKTGTEDTLYSVCFTNAQTGYVVISGTGNILKTNNGGTSWSLLNCAKDDISQSIYNELESVFFTDLNTGYAVGEKEKRYAENGYSRVILKTTDGGATWNDLLKSEENNEKIERLHSLFFIDSNIGYVCSSNGNLLKTTDGGITWTENGVGEWLVLVYFFDENTGYVIESDGRILNTTDGGDTWNLASILSNKNTAE